VVQIGAHSKRPGEEDQPAETISEQTGSAWPSASDTTVPAARGGDAGTSGSGLPPSPSGSAKPAWPSTGSGDDAEPFPTTAGAAKPAASPSGSVWPETDSVWPKRSDSVWPGDAEPAGNALGPAASSAAKTSGAPAAEPPGAPAAEPPRPAPVFIPKSQTQASGSADGLPKRTSKAARASGSVWPDETLGAAGSVWPAADRTPGPVSVSKSASPGGSGTSVWPSEPTRPASEPRATEVGSWPGSVAGAAEPASPIGAATPAWSPASLGLTAASTAAADDAAGPLGSSAAPSFASGSSARGGWSGASGPAGGSGSLGGSGAGRGGPTGPASQPGSAGGGSGRRSAKVLAVAAAVIVLIVAAGGAYLYLQKSGTASAADSKNSKSHGNGTSDAAPEHVVSITPATGSTGVNGGAAIQVVFSEPLSATSPMPTVTPVIPGTWQRTGDTAVFTPTAGFRQRTKVTVKVPSGSAGVQSVGGGLLAANVTSTFKTGSYSVVRLEQLLAQLGYLPLTWAPTTGTAATLSDANAQVTAAFDPPQGTYTWQPGYPSALMRLWKPNALSQVLRGAVAAFQADHGLMSDMVAENQDGLVVTGAIGSRLWRAMFRAIASDDTNKNGYTYALASQKTPETLTVWHNGTKIFHNLANTGIPEAPTAVGTDPVYVKYRFQIMRGTNPDGSKYADPVSWVSYFHAGEAVHYFPRYSYGFQQSLGCVELPYAPAKFIWPYLTYGTLVTVTAP